MLPEAFGSGFCRSPGPLPEVVLRVSKPEQRLSLAYPHIQRLYLHPQLVHLRVQKPPSDYACMSASHR